MAPRGSGGRRGAGLLLLLAAFAWLYGVLLGLYPKTFRRRYGPEMRRDFEELSREVLEEGGGAGLARVWGAAYSDLAVTALKERSAALPRISAGATGAIVLVAATVSLASLIEMPQYEASAKVLVTHGMLASDQRIVRTMVEVMQSRSVAEEVIKRENLDTTPQAFMENLTVVESARPFEAPIDYVLAIKVSYESPNSLEAERVVEAVSHVSSKHLWGDSAGSVNIVGPRWRYAALEAAVNPNPLRNGLLVLVSGLLVCMGLAFALPKVAASGIGRAALRATRAFVGAFVGAFVAEVAAQGYRADRLAPATEVTKEKELPKALGPRARRYRRRLRPRDVAYGGGGRPDAAL